MLRRSTTGGQGLAAIPTHLFRQFHGGGVGFGWAWKLLHPARAGMLTSLGKSPGT
jgi:hypothetical protein